MKVTLMGCGKMGSGIAEKLALQHEVTLFDRHPQKTGALAKKIGAKVAKNAHEAVSKAEVIILAVKPQDLEGLAAEIHREIFDKQLVVSCLAGVTTATLQTYFAEIPVLRIMPNLAILHGQGVVGMVISEELPKEYQEKADKLFSNLGALHWVPETQIDALTALTGSGPAFVSVLIESMIDAGVAMGIEGEKAKELVFQLIKGVVALLEETGKHPAQLKSEVASPGGTTIAGLEVLEEYGVRAGMMQTFLATYYRSLELARE